VGEIRDERRGERGAGRAVGKWEPDERAPDRPRRGTDEAEQEHEANGAGLAQGLERDAVRSERDLGVFAQRPPGEREGPCSAARERVVRKDPRRLLPPRPAVVRAEPADPLRIVAKLHARRIPELVEPVLRPGERVADSDDPEHDAAEQADDAEDESEPPEPSASHAIDRMARLPADRRHRDGTDAAHGDEEHETQKRAVVTRGGLGCAGLGKTRLLHGPPRDRDRDRDRHDQREHALQPRPADHQPRSDRDGADDHAAARRRQGDRDQREDEHRRRPGAQPRAVHAPRRHPEPERQRHRHEQCERVPVPDGLPQSRAARVLGSE
jgi:hypothetical protein